MYVRKLREPLVGLCRQQSMVVQYQLIPILFLPSWQAASKMNPQLMTLTRMCTIVLGRMREKKRKKYSRDRLQFFFSPPAQQ